MKKRSFGMTAIGNLAATLILLASSAGIAAGTGQANGSDRLMALDGPVEIGRGEPPVWAMASVGMPLESGDAIRTGVAGRAEAFIRGATVRLYENSILRVAGTSEPAVRPAGSDPSGVGATLRLGLEQGRALFDVLLGRETRAVDIATPMVVVSVRGTRFAVDATGHAVSVFRGTVAVRGLEEDVRKAILVRQGFSTRQLENGSLELISLPIADPWNDWSRSAQYPAAMQEGALRPMPVRTAEETARAARASATPRVIERVAKRDPALATRLDRLGVKSADGGDGDDESERDPVLDRTDAAIGQVLETDAVARVTESTELLLDRVTTGGPNQINITDATTGQVVTLLESDVQAILDGQVPLPTNLQTLLGGLNVTPENFTEALGLLVGRR